MILSDLDLAIWNGRLHGSAKSTRATGSDCGATSLFHMRGPFFDDGEGGHRMRLEGLTLRLSTASSSSILEFFFTDCCLLSPFFPSSRLTKQLGKSQQPPPTFSKQLESEPDAAKMATRSRNNVRTYRRRRRRRVGKYIWKGGWNHIGKASGDIVRRERKYLDRYWVCVCVVNDQAKKSGNSLWYGPSAVLSSAQTWTQAPGSSLTSEVGVVYMYSPSSFPL